MRRTILLLTTVFSFGIITGMAYVWAESGVTKGTQSPASQAGRYSIAVAGGGDAYLVDTSTGCVWRAVKVSFPMGQDLPAAPILGSFRLVSVEGIAEVTRPDAPKKEASGTTSSTTAALPQKCITQ